MNVRYLPSTDPDIIEFRRAADELRGAYEEDRREYRALNPNRSRDDQIDLFPEPVAANAP